ncbi:MAG: hypothetical protein Q4D02_01365 [Clostridia bacterium]|nr:hypothetical protein [Clostridia bacterium]
MKELKSIYEHIDESIKRNGTLDSRFNLDDYINGESIPIFELGLGDNIASMVEEHETNKRLLKLIIDIVLNLDEDTLLDDLRRVDMYFSTKDAQEDRVIYTIDEMIQFIIENVENIDEELLYRFALILMTKSRQIEAVKLGIAIFGTADFSDNDEIIAVLMKLALCEEFTFFVDIAVSTLKNANDIRFILAKKLKGWGKIMVVRSLVPTSDTIKEWLITSGVDNDIAYSKIALEVAEKIHLAEVLKRDRLTEDEFSGICKIIEGLIITHPNFVIDRLYDNYMEILTDFLRKLEGFKYNIEFLKVALLISVHLTNKAENTDDEINMLLYISKLFAEGEVFEILCDKVKNGSVEEVIICTSILNYYANMELYDEVYARFKEKPFELSFCLGYLMGRKEARDKIIMLLENGVDENKITKNVEPVMTYSDDYYENLKNAIFVLSPFQFKGIKIIVAGLKCKVMGPRDSALSILEEWMEETNLPIEEFPKEIYDALLELKDQEVIKDFKERINHLLNINEDLTKYKEPEILYKRERVVNIQGDIESLFEEKIIYRGLDYYEANMVYSCNKAEDKYTAFVQGASFINEYEVNIYCDGQGNIQKMECNCPYEQNCKHEYATLMCIKEKYYGKKKK